MNHNMDAVANINTNSDHDPDFKIFWKKLYGKEPSPKTVFNVQSYPRQYFGCYSATPKRMEYWDMAIEAGFTFADLKSMVKQHKHVAVSPHVLLNDSFRWGYGRMCIRSLYLEFGRHGQIGEEVKQVIRFILRLAAKHPLKSSSDEGISLTHDFMKMKQLHDIPLVTHRVYLWSCDLVDCDKLMFNISQNSKWVVLDKCELANGGADLCRWLSPNNCSITEVSFACTFITCDNLAKLFQSNKRINKLNITSLASFGAREIYSQQEIDQIIKLLSDASHLKKLKVVRIWGRISRPGQMMRFDTLISLLGNKSLSSLTCLDDPNPNEFEVPPETLSAQMEALEKALEQNTQLTNLHVSSCTPDQHVHWCDALVERTLRRNHRNKVRAVLCSLPTWSRPQALFGQMVMRTSKRRGTMHAMGPMDPTNETFHLLLQGSEMLKRT